MSSTTPATMSAPVAKALELVAQAVRANPFGRERDRLDQAMADLEPGLLPWPGNPLDPPRPLPPLPRLEQLRGRGRRLMENLVLCILFHAHLQDLDEHIQAQEQAGGAPLPFAPGRTITAALERAGLEPAQADHYLAVFFQMRRAWRFISSLAGNSASMRRLRQDLWNTVFTWDIEQYYRGLHTRMEDFSTLLLGPTGTGKGLAAAAVGRSGFIPYDRQRGCFSSGFSRMFRAVNLSALAEGLVEAELFGHVRGAFTGAADDRPGLLSRCPPGGVVFLDEIGELDQAIQVKLLRVLQERVFIPVGSRREERFGGRVLAATNRGLEELRGKVLRQDFFYRLSADIIELPGLRQRLDEDPDELETLCAVLLERITGAPGDPGPFLAPLRRLHQEGHAWPGNVRELEQHIRRLILHPDYRPRPQVRGDNLESALARVDPLPPARDLMSAYCRLLHRRTGSIQAAARLAGLDRRTVRKYIKAPSREET